MQAQSRNIINNRLIKVRMGWEWFWKKAADESAANPNRNEQQPASQTKTYYKQYSSERSCVTDEKDQNYLICTQRVRDGNNTYETKERVPANQGYANTSTRTYRSSYSAVDPHLANTNLQGHFDPSFKKQMEELSSFMGSLFAIPFGMFGAMPFANPTRDFEGYFAQPNVQPKLPHPFTRQPQNKQQNKQNRYYFSKKEKDYDIKDI